MVRSQCLEKNGTLFPHSLSMRILWVGLSVSLFLCLCIFVCVHMRFQWKRIYKQIKFLLKDKSYRISLKAMWWDLNCFKNVFFVAKKRLQYDSSIISNNNKIIFQCRMLWIWYKGLLLLGKCLPNFKCIHWMHFIGKRKSIWKASRMWWSWLLFKNNNYPLTKSVIWEGYLKYPQVSLTKVKQQWIEQVARLRILSPKSSNYFFSIFISISTVGLISLIILFYKYMGQRGLIFLVKKLEVEIKQSILLPNLWEV